MQRSGCTIHAQPANGHACPYATNNHTYTSSTNDTSNPNASNIAYGN